MMLVGLTGKARSGKDTLASYLETSYGFRRYSFADPIRKGLTAMLGPSWCDGEKEEPIRFNPKLKSPRYLMQTLGTEWGRNLFYDELWIDLAKYHMPKDCPVVVSDVRFENEAKFIRDCGGFIVHIQRDCAPKVREHISEAGIEKVPGDFALDNNYSISSMFSHMDSILLHELVVRGKII